MILSFRHKGLSWLFKDGDSRGLRPDMVRRIEQRLAALDRARRLRDVALPGWRLHPLRSEGRWAIEVNGPWRLTFGWQEEGHAVDVDLEDYH
jgi:toxin HigB-1